MENKLIKKLNEAKTLFQKKKFKESEAIYKELSEYIDSFSDINREEVLTYYIKFGEINANTGRLKEAKIIFDKGVKHISEEACSSLDAELLNDSAFVDKKLGFFESAETNYRTSKYIYESLDQQINPHYVHTLNNLAILLKESGELSKSESLFEEALYICEQNTGIPAFFRMQIKNNMADLYFMTGRYDESKEYYFSSMKDRAKTYGVKSPPYAESLNNLASFYSEFDKNKAEKIYKKALTLSRELFKQNDIRILKTEKNLAVLYLNMGCFEDAEPLLETSVNKMKEMMGDNYLVYRKSMIQLASLKWKLKKIKAAEQIFKTTFGFFRRTKEVFKKEFIDLLVTYSQYLFETGEQQTALGCVKTAIEEENGYIWNIIKGLSEDSALKMINKMEHHTGYFLSVILKYKKTEPTLNTLYPLIYSRKSLSFEVSFQNRLGEAMRYNSTLKDKYEIYREKRHELARRLFTGIGENEDKAAFEKRQLKLIVICKALEKDLIRILPDEQEQKTPQLQRLLKDEYVLDFYKYTPYDFETGNMTEEQHYCRFNCAKIEDDIKITVDDIGNAQKIDAFVKEYREKLCGDNNIKIVGKTRLSSINAKIKICKKLYEILVQDLASCSNTTARGKLPHCYISPDGEISNISFESLIGGNDDFFVDCFSMSYCNSVRELKKYSQKRQIKDGMIFTNPAFDLEEKGTGREKRNTFYRKDTGLINLLRKKASEDEFYGELAGTAEEGMAIRKLLEEANIPVDYNDKKEANEQKLKEIKSPSILHIATHGFFIADKNTEVPHPLFRSGIVLSGVNTALKGQLLPEKYEDGVFSAYDATTINLRDNEIVVLSACETGLGEVKNGEGILGLRRSFAQAGAKTVIMSLWRVSDKYTKILMERFYISLLEGENLAVALRDAQLALIEFLSETFGFASPSLWAGFICQGNINPVSV